MRQSITLAAAVAGGLLLAGCMSTSGTLTRVTAYMTSAPPQAVRITNIDRSGEGVTWDASSSGDYKCSSDKMLFKVTCTNTRTGRVLVWPKDD